MSAPDATPGNIYETSNVLEDPPPPGVAHLDLTPSTQPSYSIQMAPPPYHNISNAQSPYIVITTPLQQNGDYFKFHETFLKGKPKPLGIVLIVTSILQIALGIGLIFTGIVTAVISGIPFWGPIFYIIAGSLTLAAWSKPNTCLIRGSLALNIITSIFSGIGLILCCVDLISSSNRLSHDGNDSYGYTEYYLSISRGSQALTAILLITNFLLFCVSISISVTGCKSLGHVSKLPQVFVLQNGMVLQMPCSPLPGSSQITAPSDFVKSPPPPFTEFNPGGPMP